MVLKETLKKRDVEAISERYRETIPSRLRAIVLPKRYEIAQRSRRRDDRQVRRPVVDERLITAGLISFVVAAGIYARAGNL